MHIMGFASIIVHDETKDRLRKLKNNPEDDETDWKLEIIMIIDEE